MIFLARPPGVLFFHVRFHVLDDGLRFLGGKRDGRHAALALDDRLGDGRIVVCLPEIGAEGGCLHDHTLAVAVGPVAQGAAVAIELLAVLAHDGRHENDGKENEKRREGCCSDGLDSLHDALP